jgi:hypothetical protein
LQRDGGAVYCVRDTAVALGKHGGDRKSTKKQLRRNRSSCPLNLCDL